LVSEIFDLKNSDTQTYRQKSTSTDNKGRLKLSAREPTKTFNFQEQEYNRTKTNVFR